MFHPKLDLQPSFSITNSTLAYYDENGQEFADSTLTVDMSALYSRFLQHIPHSGSILDAGCGSGRDALAFQRLGYEVTAIDASRTMVEITTKLTGRPARLLSFEELDYHEAFDGVWACASLLHVPRERLASVMLRICDALKPGGVAYVSFKHGEGERESKGRHFTDFTPDTLSAWLQANSPLRLIELWETGDARPDRGAERWVNGLLRKTHG